MSASATGTFSENAARKAAVFWAVRSSISAAQIPVGSRGAASSTGVSCSEISLRRTRSRSTVGLPPSVTIAPATISVRRLGYLRLLKRREGILDLSDAGESRFSVSTDRPRVLQGTMIADRTSSRPTIGATAATMINGVAFRNSSEHLQAGVGVGGSFNMDDDRKSVPGEARLTTGPKSFGTSYGIAADAGLSIK